MEVVSLRSDLLFFLLRLEESMEARVTSRTGIRLAVYTAIDLHLHTPLNLSVEMREMLEDKLWNMGVP
jgi:hypothetical protein